MAAVELLTALEVGTTIVEFEEESWLEVEGAIVWMVVLDEEGAIVWMVVLDEEGSAAVDEVNAEVKAVVKFRAAVVVTAVELWRLLELLDKGAPVLRIDELVVMLSCR